MGFGLDGVALVVPQENLLGLIHLQLLKIFVSFPTSHLVHNLTVSSLLGHPLWALTVCS